jgi:hypothetical protein
MRGENVMKPVAMLQMTENVVSDIPIRIEINTFVTEMSLV